MIELVSKKLATLKNATITDVGDGQIIAVGEVFGHPNFTDGTFVRTSEVLDYDGTTHVMETRNTIYIVEPRED